MKLIANILSEYLRHNKRIVVPNLGMFIVKQPANVIRFSELMRNDDGVLRSLLIAYGLGEIEASGRIDRFVFEIRHAIKQGKEYSIEGLGIFTAGENNTILFKDISEPSVYGGNIKPPIETLEMEKQRLQHAERRTRPQRDPQSVVTENPMHKQQEDRKHIKRNKKEGGKRSKKNEVVDDKTISLGRPDAYLRGLKYDNDKKKQRDERSDSRRRRGLHPMFIILLIALMAVGSIWVTWRIIGGEPINFDINSLRPAKVEAVTEEVTHNSLDSLMVSEPREVWVIDGSTSKDRAIEGVVIERDTTITSSCNIVTE